MSGPLRLGLVGYGRLAEAYYAPALRWLDGVAVVAVADPLARRRELARTQWTAARPFAAASELVAAGGIDALLVASPPSDHLASWRTASAARLPAFVEKPLLLDHELVELDGSECRERVMVDFNRRFWPAYAQARERLVAGDLGRPLALEFELRLDVRAWSNVTRHRLEPDQGGVLHDLGSHALDLAGWMLGEPTALRAEASDAGNRCGIRLRYADGSTAKIEVAHGGRTRERLRVEGPRGRLWLDDPNFALHVELDGAPRRRVRARMTDAAALLRRAVRRSQSSARWSIHAALAAFVAGVREGGAFSPGASEGLRNAELVAAAVRAAGAGSEIGL